MAVPCMKIIMGELILMNLYRPALGVQFFETQCSSLPYADENRYAYDHCKVKVNTDGEKYVYQRWI